MCSTWLRIAMEEALAKKFIFLKEYWDGTAELVSLLARSDFVTGRYSNYLRSSSELHLPDPDEESKSETVKALHKTFVHHCVQYNLPNLLDLYLDHHKLVLDNDSLCLLQEAAVSFLISCECNSSFCWIIVVYLCLCCLKFTSLVLNKLLSLPVSK